MGETFSKDICKFHFVFMHSLSAITFIHNYFYTFSFRFHLLLVGIEVVDQYGNRTDYLNADSIKAMSVSADDLDETLVKVECQVNTAPVN